MNQRFKIMMILIFPLLFYFNTLDVVVAEGQTDLKEADVENIIEEESQTIEDESIDLKKNQKEESDRQSRHQKEEDLELKDEELAENEVDEKVEQDTESSDASKESVSDEEKISEEPDESKSENSLMSFSTAPPSSFGEGDNGPHVTELKKKLTRLVIRNYPANPSIVYGGSNVRNVSEFQRYYGLEVTGVADEETLAVLESNVNSPYQDGQRGDHIVELKKKLTIIGIGNYPENPSGNFGGSTEVNVRRFQNLYGLNENGIGDDVTLAELDKAMTPKDGVRGQHVVELK